MFEKDEMYALKMQLLDELAKSGKKVTWHKIFTILELSAIFSD